ncbi:hypothetical protein DSO57_1026078 [Entomophthora muscae]|uniref:Uncharacterized protein n=1 Tax=Entomophthora muscae TaxID=34485 RepID=A0ACC2UMJ3_9FUNG|nr:hypothetical protein DSO57_1026078 [Entomophthora muscae]
MKPPKPTYLSIFALSPDNTNKLFGIVYITLSGVIDIVISATGPWSRRQSYDELCLCNLRPTISPILMGWLPKDGSLTLSF